MLYPMLNSQSTWHQSATHTYRVVQKKTAQSLAYITFETFAKKSRCLHQNA